MTMGQHMIRIERELIAPVTDAVFVRADRAYNRPDAVRIPGFTIALDGEILAVRASMDAAIEYAERLRGADAAVPIIVGS